MLNVIESYMRVLLSLENYGETSFYSNNLTCLNAHKINKTNNIRLRSKVNIDLTKAFNNVLTQHNQLSDSNGNATLTRLYLEL